MSAVRALHSAIDPFLHATRIAYFSMEMALRADMHTYSGGLGVLAGDTARSATDLGLPMVFVTLVSRDGYLRQQLGPGGEQLEQADPWNPERMLVPLGVKVSLVLERRTVWVRAFMHVIEGAHGRRLPVLLLDTDLELNDPRDRTITHRLYGGDRAYRLKQEAVLGIGGCRLLQALGFSIETWHLNEGHAALLAYELLRRHPRPGVRDGELRFDPEPVREACVFTTHTPVDAGHDRFHYGMVAELLGDELDLGQIRHLAGHDELNMTVLALNLARFVNGVARKHAETTRVMFPGYPIHAVTNGVHLPTWAHPAMAALYDEIVPDWRDEPESMFRLDQVRDEDLRRAREQARAELIDAIAARTGKRFDPALPIVGFARRMTPYKRPALLFSDPARLARICAHRPFQVVMAGKAHPADQGGKAAIRELHAASTAVEGLPAFAFLPNYDFGNARTLVAGCDVWLNNPEPPLEASGTSGMKAALNGVLNLSVLDGWWIEGCVDDVTGWGLAGTAHAADELYEALEHRVLGLWHRDPARWAWMMKQAIARIPAFFNTHRMMRRYASEAYLGANAGARRRRG